jgi:uncharacterized protein YdaU (DUF1376 family)
LAWGFFICKGNVMAKDPAVLFYTSDFIMGTAYFNFEQKGQYIHLLCTQHQTGHIPTDYMKMVLGDNGNPVWAKFVQDEKTLWFNIRMEQEKIKRSAYVESRTNIGKLGGRPPKLNHKDNHMVNHMGNHTEDVNENVNKDVNKGVITKRGGNKEVYSAAFESLWKDHPDGTGKKEAYRHYQASVLTNKDEQDIRIALDKYKNSKRVKEGYIQNGSTWFNNWKDWVNHEEPQNKTHALGWGEGNMEGRI